MQPVRHVTFAILAATLAACAAFAASSSRVAAQPPFGRPSDTVFAGHLWKALVAKHFVGPETIQTHPYKGTPPHGDVIEFLQGRVRVEGHTSDVMVKKNYRGQGIDDDDVLADPAKYLASITVMFKREAGYDAEDRDWFWAKFAPDGSLLTNPKGIKLAGRVAKGAKTGCIACHRSAGGGDFVYTHDRFAGK